MKRVGVVIFPGSNCDRETVRAFAGNGAFEVVEVWHNASLPTGLDLVVLPGGWSYGDTLRAGTIARFARVMNGIVTYARDGGLVMGICNGFQVLTEAGLLPGALARNASLRFRCEVATCRIESCHSPFTRAIAPGTVMPLPIAHGEGRFVADEETLDLLEGDGMIALRYCNASGNFTSSSNPNGSLRGIAGIVNRTGNIFGLMPHPERRCHPLLGGCEGAPLLFSWADGG